MIMDGFQREADAFVARLVETMQPDYKQLSRTAKYLAIEALHDRFAGHLGKPCGRKKPQPGQRTVKPEVTDALEQCERIIEMCGEMPERGEDFATSVEEGCREVMETIQGMNHVTPDQQRALDNWEGGLSRWLDR
jgi:hypothetical protein